MVIHSTGQIFMVFFSTISQNTHKMGKISNIHTFENLKHPSERLNRKNIVLFGFCYFVLCSVVFVLFWTCVCVCVLICLFVCLFVCMGVLRCVCVCLYECFCLCV